MKRTYNLRLWFAVGSFGLIGLIFSVSAWYLAGFVGNALLQRESEVSQEFLESIIRAEGESAFAAQDQSLPANQALESFTHHLVSLPGVFRANVYSINQTILWSTEASLIGKRFDINPDLARALKGERVTEVKSLNSVDKLEHIALGADSTGHFIEAYIPVRSPGANRRILSVVEFYKLPVALNKTIAMGNQIIWLSAATASVLLFSCLYWIVQRGARVIEVQQAKLSRLEAFSALGQMAGAVAHSLRNPMANIRTSAELWGAEPHPGAREVATEVMHEIDRMDRYVRDLLAYARTDNFEMRPIDPLQVIRAAVSQFTPTLLRQSIQVSVNDLRNRPALVLADAALLEQALASVLSNAIEAMPTGGELTVSAENQGQARTVRLAIADTGGGIPRKLLRNVTEEYFTTKAGGLGLGLALALGIVDRLGGSLTIASTAGRGTTVSIFLRESSP